MQNATFPRALAFDPEICPVRLVIDEIGDKWSVLVLTELRTGSRRFSEIKRAIGDVSQRMLTQTLRKLERSGYVHRTVTPNIPPRVDYQLTPLGQGLVGALSPLAQWSLENRVNVESARTAFDAR